MWIRSQTKGELIPIKHKLSIVCEHDRATLEDKYLICHKEDILGTYDTKERAIKVLNGIQKAILGYIPVIDKDQYIGIATISTTTKQIVYEMPEE